MKKKSLNINLKRIDNQKSEGILSLNKTSTGKMRKSFIIKKNNPRIKGFKSDFKLFILIRSLLKLKKINLKKLNFSEPNKIKKKQIENEKIRQSLQEELLYEFENYTTCYEKKLPNSISNKDRDSYFLSEIGPIQTSIKEANYFHDGGIKEIIKSYLDMDPLEKNHIQDRNNPLIFDSNFEGGNLCLAFKVIN